MGGLLAENYERSLIIKEKADLDNIIEFSGAIIALDRTAFTDKISRSIHDEYVVRFKKIYDRCKQIIDNIQTG